MIALTDEVAEIAFRFLPYFVADSKSSVFLELRSSLVKEALVNSLAVKGLPTL